MGIQRRILKKIFAVGTLSLGVVLIILAGALAILWLDKPLVKRTLLRELEKRTGAQVRIERLDYSFFPLTVEARKSAFAAAGPWGRAEISVDRLKIDGEMIRLIKGLSPSIRNLSMEGVEALVLPDLTDQKQDFKGILRGISEAAGRIEKLGIRDIRARIVFPGREIALGVSDLALSRRGKDRFLLAVSITGLQSGEPGPGVRWEGLSRVTSDLEFGEVLRWDARLALAPSRLQFLDKDISLPEGSMKAAGSFFTDDLSVAVSPLTIACPGYFSASGTVLSKPGPAPSVTVSGILRADDLPRLLEFLKPHLPAEARRLGLEGRPALEARGTIDLRRGEKPRFEAAVDLGETRASYPFEGALLKISASAQMGLKGPPLEVRHAGEVRGSLERLIRAGLVLQGLEFRLPFEGGLDVFEFPSAALTIKKMSYNAGRNPLELNDLSVKAGRTSLDRKALSLNSVEASAPGVGTVRGKASFDRGLGLSAKISLGSTGIGIRDLKMFLSPLIPDNVAGWTYDGEIGFELDAAGSFRGSEPWRCSGKLRIGRAGFQDPSSSFMGEKLAAAIDVDGSYEPRRGTIRLTAAIGLKEGESLWKDLYLDWGKNPLSADLSIAWDPSRRVLDLLSSRIALDPVGEARISGVFAPETKNPFRVNGSFALRLDGLAAWVSLLRGGTSSVKVEGTAEGRFDASRTADGPFVAGRLGVRNGLLEAAAYGLSAGGIEVELPFRAGTGGEKEEEFSQAGESGYFLAEDLRTPWFEMRPFRLDLKSVGNALIIRSFTIPFSGGRAEVGEFLFSFHPAGESFTGAGSLKLEGIDLSRIPGTPASIPIKGGFRANFPRIGMTADKIVFEGEGLVTAFGGKTRIFNLAVGNPLSPGRSLRLDASFDGIDLEQLTDVVPFGRVTGTIRGEVTGLTLSYGQPEAFAFRLESVGRKGIAQKFSLRAVNSLSVISSGEKTSVVPSSWWLRFVSSFHYSKMGIASSLKNDLFTLRGTIVENGVEYLVKRSTLFGISVVNKMPDKTISFKDMVLRLRRVGESRPES